MKFPCIIALVLGCLTGTSQTNPPLWQRMEQVFEQCGYDPVNAEIEARRILEAPETMLDCDSLLLVEFLLRNSVNLLETDWPPQNFSLPDVCHHAPSPLLFVRGVTAFDEGDHTEAENWFRKAAEAGATENTLNHRQALQALGATLTHLNRHREALAAFQAAYDLAPAHTNPVELNNFAFASIVVGRCAEAVGWCNLALDRVQTAVEEGAPYAKYLQSERNAILLTRFFAELQLRDEAAYVKTLSEIDLQGAWNGRELAAVCALTNHALWLDEPERFAAIRPVLSKWIEAESSADVLEAIGACHALFAPWNPGEAWRTEWDRVRQVPEVFRGLPRTNCAESAPVVRTDRSMPFGIAATWGLLLVALGAAFFLVALWRRHRRVVALDALTAPAWEERVEAALLGGKPLSRMERLEALRSVRNLAHQDWQLDQIRSAQIQHWPELEQNVARHLADGEHTKAIAQRLDISVAMVYKTRHAIRNRLDLQPNDSLRKRLQELLHVILLVGTLTGNTIAQDAVITAIHDNDSAQWLAAMMELRQLEKASLPAPFDAALLPMEQRPDWAQVPDSMWWIWFKTAAAPLEVALAEEAPHDLLLTPSGEASDAYFERHSLLKSEHTPFLAALLLLLLGGIAGLSIRMRRLNLRPEQSHWMAIAAGLKEPSAREEAIRTWKAFKAKQPQPAVSEDFWGVLTSTEQEVAQFLAQDWTAAQIAKHFSCSPGNVYNLRSSIRRKWSLDATDDLVRFIQALQAENE